RMHLVDIALRVEIVTVEIRPAETLGELYPDRRLAGARHPHDDQKGWHYRQRLRLHSWYPAWRLPWQHDRPATQATHPHRRAMREDRFRQEPASRYRVSQPR